MGQVEEKWQVEYHEQSDAWIVFDKNEHVIASGLSETDARLIAAAPELLDTCKRDAQLANAAISATPTGRYRNKLTELNILRLQAITEAEMDK